MSRTELLEQLAEKATRWRRTRVGPNTQFWDSVTDDMIAAIDALDALPATPGEMVVEVALGLWADAYGQTALFRADTVGDGRKAPGWTRLGTIRLALTEDGGDAD